MSRYIDADALLSKGPFVVRMNDWGEYFVTVEEINKMPTTDAVPVVRCRECAHYETAGCKDGYGWCNARVVDSTGVYDDFFCADGERRSDEQS